MALGGGRNAYFEYTNRNKRGIAIDLGKKSGKEIVYRLVKTSDVFVQNFRQGVGEKLGLDYKTLCQHNPRLIYANASGWGSKGKESGEPTFDLLGLARSGIMNAITEPGLPPLRLSGGIADQMGAIMLSYGILAALLARERSGVAQEIDSSHLGSMITLQGLHLAFVCALGQEIPKLSRDAVANPLWSHYRCRDGKWICLAHLQADRYWPSFCRAIGREDWGKDPRFANAMAREKSSREIIKVLDEVFATRTAKEWMEHLKSQGDFICYIVNTVSDLPNDPQALVNEYIINYDHPVLGKVKTVGFPVQFSKTPPSLRCPAPELGQNTEEVLSEYAGYTWDEIEELKKREVI